MTREVTQATLALEGINDRPGQEPGAQPVASICIATGRRPELLACCLDSLGHQEAAPTFEVLVCADGDASVVDLARRHLPEARVIVVPRANRTILRNRLMVQARGDLLVFLDDDVVVEKGFLRRLQDLSVAHPEIGVFGGPNLTPDQSSVFQITQGAVLGSLVAAGPVRRRYGRHPAELADERWFTLCNLAVRREVMVDFTEDLRCAEENAVLDQLRRNGVAMYYDPDLVAYHERRPRWRSFAGQMRTYGYGRGQLIRRKPRTARPALFAPSLVLAYCVLAGPLSLLSLLALVPLGVYALVVAAGAVKVGYSLRRPASAFLAAALILTVHACYGTGVLLGLAANPRRAARTAKGLGRPGLSLLAVLVGRQLRLQTKRSKIGIAWPIVAPLFLLALYSLVFRGVFHVPIKRYPEYLFAGLLPWTFLVQSLASAISSISDEPDLIRRARFAYEALPLATVTAMSVYFLVTLGGFLVYLGVTGHLVFHLLPALVAPLASLYLLVGAISLVLSLIDVYNRDLRRVLANLLTIWFFLEPIVYRQEMLGGGLLFLRSVDPVNMIVGEFRDLLVYGHLPPPAHVAELLAISGAVYLICVQVFRRFAPNLPKVV